jgi:mannan endo-1,4-beta-mannosidase
MNVSRIAPGLWLSVLVLSVSTVSASDGPILPVTPKAAPEAVELLKFIDSISGKQTLTGQHNLPNTKDTSTQQAFRTYGKWPAIFGQDFGFAAPGDKDAVAARPEIMAEVKRQYAMGSIITLCWHAVPPTADEPVTFRPRPRSSTNAPAGGTNAVGVATNTPGSATNLLASVQGRLTDEQWNDVITPGTELYKHWCSQVDVIAGYLKQLQEARVPVLWRPYHEMNGNWFWWGGRPGEHGTKALYRQLFDRLVNHHKLTNLIWIWSVDRPGANSGAFADYFPGTNYFDIASLDVYRSDFKQDYYDALLKLAAGKPISLAEVGPAPTLNVLELQPRWTWWMTWGGMFGGRWAGTNTNAVVTLVNNPRSWSRSDPAYVEAIARIRAASGLPPLSPAEKPAL